MARILCVGVGHVGLPLSLKLWAAGHDVVPLDVDTNKIEMLRAGSMPFVERGCDAVLRFAAGDPRFSPIAYTDPEFGARVNDAEYIVMTLGTPLGGDHTFRFDQYFDVLAKLTPHLRRGVTLIVRSTVAPRFTRNVVSTRIAAERDWIPGTDFFPSFCPERLQQGNALDDIDRLPEIIGSDDPETARRAESLFASLAPDKQCIHVSTVEAELTKLFLNTYRYTLFGLANEFALCAEQYGADMHSILQAANDGYVRGGIPQPGPSRGPCLGKDTAALAFSSTFSFIAHAALKTHDNLLLHVVNDLRAALGSFAHRRVCILGLAFKAGTDDVRDNLTNPLADLLVREGATVAIYDPLVAGSDRVEVLRHSDALVLMTPHREIVGWSERDVVELCARQRAEVFVFDLWDVWPWADEILGRGRRSDDEGTGHGGIRLAHASGDSPTGRRRP